jgi:DNA-binding SARP family transcriptional activator/predicted ATPase
MAHLSLACFGVFQVNLDGRPLIGFHSTKIQALLAYLALEADRPHARETLATLLWPLDSESSARNSLRQALYELRKLLGDRDDSPNPFLLVTRQTVQFNLDSSFTLDVADFFASIKREAWEPAATLYRGAVLSGLSCESEPFEEWLRQQRAYCHNLAVDACFRLTNQALQRGDFTQARTYAQRQLSLEPWREEAHRQLMTALALSGERSAALAQYEICRRALADELGVEPDTETTTLYEQIEMGKLRGQRAVSLPLPVVSEEPVVRSTPPPTVRHNLPPQPTTFIGRQTDLAQITARLHDPACRLLTIVGPGGMGKTRLALQTAQTILDLGSGALAVAHEDNRTSELQNPKFQEGIFFVALAGVASPELIVSTIAATLDFNFYGNGEQKTQLLEYLRPKTMLLVLDNFEHLLDGAELIAELLAVAPSIKVLVTSREALNLHEEWLHPLGGMSFPGDETDAASGPHRNLTDYTAVQLFLHCAQRMKPGFALSSEESAVRRICRLVGGMPLGIEMATSWLKHFSADQIAMEIERNLDFLATTLRNVPSRHRSIRAVFEHSWSLLSPVERQVLKRLAVFRGGFRFEAAQQVAEATFPLLVSLAEKSLVQPTPSGRYTIHELLRQFAAEKLQASPQEWVAVQERHGHFYLHFLEQHTAGLEGRESAATTATVEKEIENIRLAWQWAIKQQKLDELELGLTGVHHFFWVKQWYQEGAALLGQAARVLAMEKPAGRQGLLWARCLALEARLLDLLLVEVGKLGNVQQAISLCQQSLTILQELHAESQTGVTLACLARCYYSIGNFAVAQSLFKQALTILSAQGNSVWLRRAIHDMGFMDFVLGQYETSMDYFQQCIALSEECGDPKTKGDALNLVGEIYRVWGDYTAARQAAQAALVARTTVDDKRGISWSLQLLGQIAWHLADYTTAKEYSLESFTLFNAIGLTHEGYSATNVLGRIALSLNDYREARHHFSTVLVSLAKTKQQSFHWIDIVAIVGLAMVYRKEDEPSLAVQLLTHAHRHPAGLQDTKEWAAALLHELAATLPEEQFAAAQKRAETQALATVLAGLLGNEPSR